MAATMAGGYLVHGGPTDAYRHILTGTARVRRLRQGKRRIRTLGRQAHSRGYTFAAAQFQVDAAIGLEAQDRAIDMRAPDGQVAENPGTQSFAGDSVHSGVIPSRHGGHVPSEGQIDSPLLADTGT